MEIKWICIVIIAYITLNFGEEALKMYERLEKEKIEISKLNCGEKPMKQDLDYVEIEKEK